MKPIANGNSFFLCDTPPITSMRGDRMMQFGAGQQKGKKVLTGNKDVLLIRPSNVSPLTLERVLVERSLLSSYVL